MSDPAIDSVSSNPNQVWNELDTFLATQLVQSDSDLIRFQTYASMLTYTQAYGYSQHFINAQSISTLEPFATIAWYPFVIYQDHLSSQSYKMYGVGGYSYAATPQILYGQSGATQYQYGVTLTFADIPILYDSVTATQHIIDKTLYSFDPVKQLFTFTINPFSLITPRTTTTGRSYVVLWARNAKLDLTVPFDWTGWLLKFKGSSSDEYVGALKSLWTLETCGPSMASIKSGLTLAAGYPVATEVGTVRDVISDGYQTIVITDNKAYTAPVAVSAAVIAGQTLSVGQPVTNGFKFFTDAAAVIGASAADLPGIAVNVPLSTGTVASLFFPNKSVDWTYLVSRTSPWRFPIGGDSADVEQYWVDRNVDMSIYYAGLTPPGPGPSVNPMAILVDDLLKGSITVASCSLANLKSAAVAFIDRARLTLPDSSYFVIQQAVAAVTDVTDLSASATPTPGYGYHESGAADINSVSGSNVVYVDYAPSVFIY